MTGSHKSTAISLFSNLVNVVLVFNARSFVWRTCVHSHQEILPPPSISISLNIRRTLASSHSSILRSVPSDFSSSSALSQFASSCRSSTFFFISFIHDKNSGKLISPELSLSTFVNKVFSWNSHLLWSHSSVAGNDECRSFNASDSIGATAAILNPIFNTTVASITFVFALLLSSTSWVTNTHFSQVADDGPFFIAALNREWNDTLATPITWDPVCSSTCNREICMYSADGWSKTLLAVSLFTLKRKLPIEIPVLLGISGMALVLEYWLITPGIKQRIPHTVPPRVVRTDCKLLTDTDMSPNIYGTNMDEIRNFPAIVDPVRVLFRRIISCTGTFPSSLHDKNDKVEGNTASTLPVDFLGSDKLSFTWVRAPDVGTDPKNVYALLKWLAIPLVGQEVPCLNTIPGLWTSSGSSQRDDMSTWEIFIWAPEISVASWIHVKIRPTPSNLPFKSLPRNESEIFTFPVTFIPPLVSAAAGSSDCRSTHTIQLLLSSEFLTSLPMTGMSDCQSKENLPLHRSGVPKLAAFLHTMDTDHLSLGENASNRDAES